MNNLNIHQTNTGVELGINIPESQLLAYTQTKNNRLIIEIWNNKKEELKKQKSNMPGSGIYPGVTHKQYKVNSAFINVVSVDLNNPFVELVPVSASKSTLFSKRSVNSIVNTSGGIAGINASFFKPPTGLPLGALLINGEFLTGPIFNRVALVIDENNKAYLDKIRFDGIIVLPDNTTLPLQNINQPRTSTEGFMLYSDKWYGNVPKSLKNELQVLVFNGKVIQKTLGSLKVPYGAYVITGPNKEKFKELQIGNRVIVNTRPDSYVRNIKHAIGGGPYLIKDGKIYIDAREQKFSINGACRDPRTAIGITNDNHLLLVTADGRQKGSSGMSFYQLAHFLKSLGAVQAMNFDGGSSTQMSIKGKIVNRPTVRGGAAISTAIVVKPHENYTLASKLP